MSPSGFFSLKPPYMYTFFYLKYVRTTVCIIQGAVVVRQILCWQPKSDVRKEIFIGQP
jgi:hypothetical protein